MTQQARTVTLGVVIVVILGLVFYFESQKPRRVVTEGSEIQAPTTAIKKQEKSKRYLLAKEITTPDGFINAGKISISEFIGKKVVLIDFWTYSCINCQRTIPYLNAWYEKYKDKGFVIIGVHTPEFEFEKKYENVLAAVKKFDIKYPVVLDNDFSTWNAYGNRYWPRKYLIDIDGFIVYDHIGEGAYEETEQKIQELLEERLAALGSQEEINQKIGVPRDISEVSFRQIGSPEIYFGASRNEYLGNGESGKTGTQTLEQPSSIDLNTLYIVGDWDFDPEFAENKSSNAKIIFRYKSKDVYFVASASESIKIKVLRDGKPFETKFKGADITISDGESFGTVKEDRLYTIIEDQTYGEHTLEIIIENPGLKAFTFTFG